VSEQILNDTSAQLGYTMSFTLVHVRKYRTEDKLKTQTLQKLSTTQKKQTTQNTAKQNLSWFSRLLQHSARKRGGLILQCSRAHTEQRIMWRCRQRVKN